MDTSPEDIATWLARETGHVPEADAGYEEPKSLGLPNQSHEGLRKFFDGLHVEKALTEKRRNEALSAVDDAEEMHKALGESVKATPPTPQGY